ncbi:hypothetical protein PN509_07815 [Nodularia spumigena CS-588/02]|uniref:hypothetical protein n=1 Tax=Nodularia spumigena TaxID=70799 RepID=UPI00232FED24|nr:hypothetical protein [Nodularia spumigena]MDB9360232.1 hypothetical protein [Nodularia spumigena CS-588/02]
MLLATATIACTPINKAKKAMTLKWLTPEQAIVEAKLTVTSEILESYIQLPGKTTTEAKFQGLGLLFDRERWLAGQPDFLQLLPSVIDDYTTTEDETDCHNLDHNGTETFATNHANLPEPYIFEQCKVQIVITLLPTEQATNRPVMIAASSHGDFPVVAMFSQEQLADLLPVLEQLLDELKADFPNRQIRRNIAQTQADGKQHTSQIQAARTKKLSISQTSTGTQTADSNSTKSTNNSTQITLF